MGPTSAPAPRSARYLSPQGILGVGPAFLVDPIGACRGLAGIGAPYVGSACDSRGLRVLGAACAVGLGGGSRKGHGLGPACEVVQKKIVVQKI